MRLLAKKISLTQPAPIQVDSTEPEVIETALEQIPAARSSTRSTSRPAARSSTGRAGRARARGRADRADDRRGRDGQDRERKLEIAQAHSRSAAGSTASTRELLIFDCLTFTLHDRRRGVARRRRSRRLRGSPDQGGRSPTCKTSLGVSNVSFGVCRRSAVINERVPAPLRRGGARPGDGQPQPHHALRRDPPRGARARRRPRASTAGRMRSSGSSPTSSPGARRPASGGAADPTEGMEPEEALHFHILRRRKEGVETGSTERREDRGGPDAQPGAAAGDEGGRRQVRRRRADPAVRAAVRRGDEAGRRAAGAATSTSSRATPRARSCWRPCSGTSTTSASRSSTRSSRTTATRSSTSASRSRSRRSSTPPGTRRDRDRALGAARLDLQADAGVHPGAAARRASPTRC